MIAIKLDLRTVWQFPMHNSSIVKSALMSNNDEHFVQEMICICTHTVQGFVDFLQLQIVSECVLESRKQSAVEVLLTFLTL